MIEYLYNKDYMALSKIRFDEFDLLYEDNYRISIGQKVYFTDDMESDEEGPLRIELHIATSTGESAIWTSDDPHELDAQNLNIYLNSHPIYFIKDDRMGTQGQHEVVGRANVVQFRSFLLEMSQRINSALIPNVINDKEKITEQEYVDEMRDLRPTINAMLKYDIIKRNPIPEFSESNSALCRNSIELFKSALTPDIEKNLALVATFDKIVAMYQYANKTLEISPSFGYRFKATDDTHSILSFNELSSGERHILLINYDLLFNAPDDSLVLIDEPEMSFHLEWQGLFMENLNKILETRDLQCVICTHSPEMFGYQWDKSVDLFELSQEYKEAGE